jgi:hypothetical protein
LALAALAVLQITPALACRVQIQYLARLQLLLAAALVAIEVATAVLGVREVVLEFNLGRVLREQQDKVTLAAKVMTTQARLELWATLVAAVVLAALVLLAAQHQEALGVLVLQILFLGLLLFTLAAVVAVHTIGLLLPLVAMVAAVLVVRKIAVRLPQLLVQLIQAVAVAVAALLRLLTIWLAHKAAQALSSSKSPTLTLLHSLAA